MVESICGQGFAYAHEVEEDWAKELVKLGQQATEKRQYRGQRRLNKIQSGAPADVLLL
jgi:hypothetical protein